MARKAVLEGGKKDEIISVALKLFLENGYEGTSIRMILEKVDGEVGMFYHYFTSKQEVFNRSFELFMKKQGEKFSLLMSQKFEDTTPGKRLKQLGVCYVNTMDEYAKLSNSTIHWTVLSALHEITLEAMLPSFRKMLVEILKSAGNDNFCDVEWFAPFILKGISGLLHEKSFVSLPEEKKMELTIDFMCRTMQIPRSIFG